MQKHSESECSEVYIFKKKVILGFIASLSCIHARTQNVSWHVASVSFSWQNKSITDSGRIQEVSQ